MDNLFVGLDLIEIKVLLFRMLMIPLILFNLSFTAPGFWQVMRGNLNPSSLYRSVLFFGLVPQLGFHLTSLSSMEQVGEGPLTLLWLMFFMLFNVGAAAGRVLNQFGKFDDLIELYQSQHIGTAIRVVQLSNLDRETMERYLNKVEIEVVKKVVAEDVGVPDNSTK